MNMTTQQKLDCLLKHFDMLAESQGDGVALANQDIALLKKQCRFANLNEIGLLHTGSGRKRARGFGLCGGQRYPAGAHHH